MPSDQCTGALLKTLIDTREVEAQLTRKFPFGQLTALQIIKIESDALDPLPVILAIDHGGGTSITNAAEIYWPAILNAFNLPENRCRMFELYAGAEIQSADEITLFDGVPRWTRIDDELAPKLRDVLWNPAPSETPVTPSPGLILHPE